MAPLLLLIGFSAVVAQIVLMRELIVVFHGNEISIGIALASWLFWTSAGSALASRVAVSSKEPRRFMAALQIALAIALPLSVAAVRTSRAVFQAVPGELLGPGAMFLGSFVALCAPCLLSGALFAAGSRLYASEKRCTTATATGRLYLLEAAGSALGGILASLILIPHLGSISIAVLLACLNFLAAAYLLSGLWFGLAGLAVLASVWVAPRLEKASQGWLWQGFDVVATRDSPYGSLTVTRAESSMTLYQNGLAAFSVPDPAAAEETVHYALLQQASPHSLLLIGGGLNGSVAQAFQHTSLKRIDYVELDPAVIELAKTQFSSEWSAIRDDPRVRVHLTDGRLFVKTVRDTFDVIIVSLPDPQTAQLNRFYTAEFFREAALRLTPGGVLSFRLTGAENYISPDLAAFLRCINRTLRESFPEVLAMPGDAIHFFAATQPGVLTRDPQTLIARIKARGLRTEYVREYYLPFRLMPDRLADLDAQIRPLADTPVNRDFAPIAYYFGVALWSSRFHSGYRTLFQSAAQAGFGGVAGFVAVLTLGLAFFARRRGRGVAASVAAMGFTQIGLELLLLLGFQAAHGYVYQQLAVVIAGFMAGMALGSWWALRQSSPLSLLTLQIAAAASALLIYPFLSASHMVFPLLALLCGVLGGYQFAAACRQFRGSNPGALYAFDLAGACLAAVALSAFTIPVFGFFLTALLIAIVNAAAALTLAGLRGSGTSGSESPAR